MFNLSAKLRIPPWERSRVIPSLLIPFGLIYGLVMELRNRLYDFGIFKIHRLQVPVISIGNLTVGGAGKTPLTIEIVRGLLRRNSSLKIAVISRGYRRKRLKDWVVSDGEDVLMGVDESGDEPRLIAKNLPGVKVFVGSDRVAIGRRAIERYPLDLLVLDDAFQHRRIYRDVDIIVMDGEKGMPMWGVLPSGPLREFVWNLKRATCLVVSHPDAQLPQYIRRYCKPETPVFKVRLTVSGIMDGISRKEIPLKELKGERVWGICGIAHPDSFLKTLRELEVEIEGFISFPDHHPYSWRELKRISIRTKGRAVITTEKDWVKWESNHPFTKVYVVSIKTEFENRENFYDFIEGFVYNRKKGVQGGLD